MKTLETILKERGPSLSSELVSMMVMEQHIQKDAARKRISRVQPPIRRLYGLNLPNRENFLYLDDQYKKPEFYDQLIESLKKTRSSYGRALIGLEARNGIIKRALFPIASGLPIFNTKGQVLHKYVEEKLIELGIIEILHTLEGEFIGIANCKEMSRRRQACLIVESIVLSSIKSWLANMGFSSINAIDISSDTIPTFGPFHWDLAAPSYLSGLADRAQGKVKNGFVVGDIILNRLIKEEDILPFLSKCDAVKNQKNQRKFIPIFIADSFDAPALGELRRRGILIARPATIFGDEIAEHLKNLIYTIENAAAALVKNPESVFQLVEKVGKIEGASQNLRGVVLEFIIGRIYSLDGYNIEIRQQVYSSRADRAEIDVKAVKSHEVVCIECKGKMPGNLVSRAEIEEWLDDSLPVIKSWLKNADSLPDKKRFEFYTSTDYADDAKELIEKIRHEHKKQPISFLSGIDIVTKLRMLTQNSLVRIFTEQFVR
ncbi:MAG: hypothetical protein WCJ37_17810 [Syntrophus sp. (in: bacteria)]